MPPSVISRADLLRAGKLDRLDAEFFDAERIELEAAIETAGGTRLDTYAELSDLRVPDPRKAADPTETISYIEIGGVDRADGFALTEEIPSADAPSRARMRLDAGMVALSSVRPNRNQVALVSPDLDGAVGSTGFTILRARDLPPEVLFVYLKTPYAIRQLEPRARASMYPTLNPPEVLEIWIPPIPEDVQTAVGELIRSAGMERQAFLSSAGTADSIGRAFFESMGPAQLETELAVHGPAARSRRDVMQGDASRRLDAEFHAPAFDRALKRMADVAPIRAVGELAAHVTAGRSPKAAEFSDDDDGGAVVLKLAALSGYGVKWSVVTFAPARYANDGRSEAIEGDVLFNSTAHEPNYIAHRLDVVGKVPADFEGRLAFISDLTRVRLDDPEKSPPHYLAAFLRNPLGKHQVRRCIRGVRAHVYPDDVAASVWIPEPPAAVSDGIAAAAAEAEASRWRYAQLVDEAIATLTSAIAAAL